MLADRWRRRGESEGSSVGRVRGAEGIEGGEEGEELEIMGK